MEGEVTEKKKRRHGKRGTQPTTSEKKRNGNGNGYASKRRMLRARLGAWGRAVRREWGKGEKERKRKKGGARSRSHSLAGQAMRRGLIQQPRTKKNEGKK